MMGFFSKIFASANTAHTAHDAAADDAEAARQAQIKKIEALLDSVNSASQHVRNYYITFLLACFYIAIIVWSTTDLMLLKDTPVTMPLLNVNLPITGFYTFAPYFFLLLHFNLLLQFSLLADKTHRFDQAVIELRDEDSRRYYYTRLFAFAFTQILSARHHSRLLRFLLTLMVWITAIWLPLGILIGLQVGFLPYHDESTLFWQRIAVTLDLLVLLIFWPVIRAPDSRWRSWIKQASGLSWLLKMKTKMQPIPPVSTQESINQNSGYPLLEGTASLLTGFCVIVFVWGIAVLPDSVHEKNVRDWLKAHAWLDAWHSFCPSKETKEPYFIATEWLFDGRYGLSLDWKNQCNWKFTRGEEDRRELKAEAGMLHRNLVLRGHLLIANELKAEDEADLTNGDETMRQAALKKVTKLVLSGRDLRYADFSEARLPKADFFGADGKPSDLRYANFSNAMLVDARMEQTKLQGANLNEAKLQGANLNEAELQGADLTGAKLQGTDLFGAKLQRANLTGANLQEANLLVAKLQGANLRGAKLQGADLTGAKLQGANLNEAELQGADLTGAKLQGTDLFGAKLQGANLDEAELQGVDLFGVKLQGANLTGAKLQGADLMEAELQGANLSGAKLQGANLYEAKLQGANFFGAELQGTYLQRADFSHNNITEAQFGWLTQSILEDLQKTLIGSIQDESLRKNLIDKLTERTKAQIGIFAAQGDNVWDGSYRNRFYSALNGLVFNGSKSDYQNKLTGYLIALACQDRWTADGIVQNRMEKGFLKVPIVLAGSAARCLLSFKDQKNQDGKLVCPAMSEIDHEKLRILQEIAAEKNSDETITPTFLCRTERSDPVSAVD